MESITFQGQNVKATIPRALYLAVVRLQGANNLDWDDACSLAAERIDSNTKEFEKSVEKEVLSRHRSKLMVELNKARKSIEEGAYERARKHCQIWYLCSICGKPIDVRPNSDSHKAIMEHMKEAGWGHAACHRNETA